MWAIARAAVAKRRAERGDVNSQRPSSTTVSGQVRAISWSFRIGVLDEGGEDVQGPTAEV